MNVSIWEELRGDPQLLPPAQIYCKIGHQVVEVPTIETYTRKDKYISLSDLDNGTNDLFYWMVEAFC